MMLGQLDRFQIRHLYPVVPIAFYAVLSAGPISDNSFLWHVRAGAVQLASSSVLIGDPFSYLAESEVWRTQSWLIELLYAFAESTLGGVGWAPMWVGIIVIGAMSVTGLVVYANVHSTFSTALWLFVVGWLLVPFSQPRPVVVSYLLLAALVLALALGDRARWVVVPLIWLWAGIHGSWLIGLGLVMLVAVSRRSLRTASVGAVAAVATLATAHGIGAWSIVVSFARSSSALDYMTEWNAPDFGSILQAPYLIVIVGLIVAAVKGRIAMSDLWVAVPFMLLGFVSQRTVPVAALVLLPFAARSVKVSLPTVARRFNALPWFILSTLIAVAVVAHTWIPHGFDTDRFPSNAALEAVATERFFHDDVVGGYLIYTDGPEQQVYIDDRAELYGATLLAEYVAARGGDYRELFDRLSMTAALVRLDWPLRAELLRDGWHVEYHDGTFEVLVEG